MKEQVNNTFRGGAPPAGGGSAGATMFYVYAIFNPKHKKLYIGQTRDLNNRLKLHQKGTFERSYTSQFGGKWILVHKENLDTRKEAIIREKQLKSYRGREFIKLKINHSAVAQW